MREDSSLDVMERRLQEWAAWLVGGNSASGYPVTNVLHQSWMPPAPGQTPTMKTGGRSYRREMQLHAAVRGLSVRLQNTLVVVYIKRLAVEDQAVMLECQPSTVRARVVEAKRALLPQLA